MSITTAKIVNLLGRSGLWVLLLLIFLVVLYAGIFQQEKVDRNLFTWQPGGGLSFGKHAIGYTDVFFLPTLPQEKSELGFSFEFDLEMPAPARLGRHIFGVHSDQDPQKSLIFWQWGKHLIAMNGYDYNHKEKLPRVSAELDRERHKIKLTTENGKTKLYVDGVWVSTLKGDILTLPQYDQGLRIVAGNSITRKKSWQGALYSFKFTRLSKASSETQTSRESQSIITYRFDEQEGYRVIDHSGQNNHLYLPKKPPLLKRVTFSTDVHPNIQTNNMLMDVTINLFGFMPLGFVITLLLQRTPLGFKKSILMALAVGFCVSLAIEYGQSWMPARTSSLRDLMTNTLGAYLGALICWPYLYLRQKIKK